MLNKIFLALFAIVLIAMLVLTHFQYSWLYSITNPTDVVAQYNFYNNAFWSFLWISSLALLIFGNVILWKSRKSWAIWLSFLFFAAFVLTQTWWMDSLFTNYKSQKNLGDNLSLKGIFGTLICIVVAVGVFFDQFLVLRMRDRIHGNPQIALETKSESNLTEAKDLDEKKLER